jgi:3-oxoacyl-[acyl-carrier protein] reductase
MNSLNEQVFVLVTGASEGIGKAIALKLLQSQYRVGFVSRSQNKLEAALYEAGDTDKKAWTYAADLTHSSQVDQLIKETLIREGSIDVLINNVGRGIRRELIDTTDEDWDFMVNTNLSSAFYASRAVLPHMRRQQKGIIINIASRAGRRGEGDFAAYSAMKHGLVGLTRALADSEAKYGILVNAVCPGLVATQRLLTEKPNLDYSNANSPGDVAEAVMFLLSPAARTMNGQVIDLFSN